MRIKKEKKKRKEHDGLFKNMARALVGGSMDMEEKKFRLGKKVTESTDEHEVVESRPRLMMVTLSRKQHVIELMTKRWSLKDERFPNIYLARDLPHEEREEQKRLRKELAEKGAKGRTQYFGEKKSPKDQRFNKVSEIKFLYTNANCLSNTFDELRERVNLTRAPLGGQNLPPPGFPRITPKPL